MSGVGLTVYLGEALTCITCGTAFAMSADLERQRRNDHTNFYCPNGHGQRWMQETEAERYKRLHRDSEDRLAAVRANLDQKEASRRAWKGQATRLRRRAAAGLCAFCRRHFDNVAEHVAEKHPDEPKQELPA